MMRASLLCAVMILFCGPAQATEFDQKVFEQAKANLVQTFSCSSCNPEHLKLIQSAKMNNRAIALKFLNILESGPSTNRLAEYTTKSSINKVQAFMKEHQSDLCATYAKTNVDPFVVTSLLYMETLFGSEAIPWFKAIDSIVSLAVLQDDAFAAHVIETLRPKMRIYKRYKKNPGKWKRYDRKKRASWIAGDWEDHLRAYLKIAKLQSWPKEKVLDMKSSWAGAIGYSQFMPMTALPYFQKEQTLDFWKWKDSFLLTSMYLRDEGFGKNTEQALKAYNSPKWYRDTILHLSHIMRHKYPDYCDPKDATTAPTASLRN